jgi:hypothetical protein
MPPILATPASCRCERVGLNRVSDLVCHPWLIVGLGDCLSDAFDTLLTKCFDYCSRLNILINFVPTTFQSATSPLSNMTTLGNHRPNLIPSFTSSIVLFFIIHITRT